MFSQSKTTERTEEEFASLAGDLEAVWNNPASDARLKKQIVGALIEEVVVDTDAARGEITAVAHWKGGVHTELSMARKRRGHSRAHTSKEIVEAVSFLTRICSDDMITGTLTRNGLLTGMGNRWTRERVVSLRSPHGISCYSEDRRHTEGWLTLTEAAAQLGVSGITLRLAIERGEIDAEHPLRDAPWVLNRRGLEIVAAAQIIVSTPVLCHDRALPPGANVDPQWPLKRARHGGNQTLSAQAY